MNKEINLSYICTILRSLSSIFLVQDDHWHPDIKSVFGKDHLLLVHKTLQEQFSVRSFSSDFDKKLTDTIVDIVKVKTFTHKKVVNIADCYIGFKAEKHIALGCAD